MPAPNEAKPRRQYNRYEVEQMAIGLYDGDGNSRRWSRAALFERIAYRTYAIALLDEPVIMPPALVEPKPDLPE